MKKGIIVWVGMTCLWAIIIVSCVWLPVQAEESRIPAYILDTRRWCELIIRTDAGQGTAGARLTVYAVGRVDATNVSLAFVLNEDFAGSKVDLMAEGSAQRRQTIEALHRYAEEQEITPISVVELDEKGYAKLKVPQGAYLICQEEAEQTEEGSRIQATLVGVPYVGASLDQWIYEMEVQLKAVMSVATGDPQDPMRYAALVGAVGLLLGLLLLARKRSKQG